MSVSIKNLTRSSHGGRPSVFSTVANEVLPGWEVSLVFVTPAKARALNKQLRKKAYTPNVLSYVAGKKSGEIIICPAEAAKQAPAYKLKASSYTLLLFIHGLLHIKGWSHSGRMEKCERDLLQRYEAAYSRGSRHRHLPGKDRRRRRALR